MDITAVLRLLVVLRLLAPIKKHYLGQTRVLLEKKFAPDKFVNVAFEH